ncbi:hypothetical protein J132_09415 [Termitomyces sp. J132]|nr:hypothetical protein J132_09415 [Termitomyces sp. J132]
MSQLANPDNPPEVLASQDKAWTCLLHLENQVQLTQSSLTHHTTKLSTLCQTTNHISQSLQAMLEHLSLISALPLVVEPPLATLVVAPIALLSPQPWIPHPMFPDAYNGAHSGGECFLQSCLTYIHLSTFDSNVLKIAWVLSYIKTGWASTYALWVFYHPRGIGSFADWATFEEDFQAEFFPIDPAKTATLVLCDREQYRQEKQMLDEYINSFQVLVKQATYSNNLQLCLVF